MFDFIRKWLLGTVHKDVDELKGWVNHLHEKSANIENSHNQHTAMTRKDISNINQWLHYLHAHNNEVQKHLKQTTEHIIGLHRKNEHLARKLQLLEEKGSYKTPAIPLEQKKTARVTQSDTQSDVGVTLRDASDVQSDAHLHNIGSFSDSEKKIISALYNSEKPVTYGSLSKLLGLNYSTVKNIIYKLRKKGFDIQNHKNSKGEKEFFITKKVKIYLSGR